VLAFQVSVTVCWTEAPVPLAVSRAEPEVDVKKEIFAEDVPVVLGAKVTVNDALCPELSVVGSVSPLIVKAALLELADDTVTLPPLAVMLPAWL